MRNPFRIEPPAQICFSTGRTSAYMLYRIIEAYGGVSKNKVDGSVLPKGLIVCFENTGKERNESLDFGHEVETRWNVDLKWLEYNDEFKEDNYLTKAGKKSERRKPFTFNDPGLRIVDYNSAYRYNPAYPDDPNSPYVKMITYYAKYKDFIEEPRVLPNFVDRMCTAHLKIKVGDRYTRLIAFQDKSLDYDAVLGIRFDEPSRYHKMMKMNQVGSDHYQNSCPLYEAKILKPEIMKFWGYSQEVDKDGILRYIKTSEPQGFDLRLDPDSEEGNCDLCFLKKTNVLIRIMKETPIYTPFWLWAENFTGTNFGKTKPTFHQLDEMIRTNDPRLEKIAEKAKKSEKVIDCICGEA